jgi:hypothetical protein
MVGPRELPPYNGGAGVRAFAGLAPDLFAGDAAALGSFRNAFFNEGKFDPVAFQNRQNFLQRWMEVGAPPEAWRTSTRSCARNGSAITSAASSLRGKPRHVSPRPGQAGNQPRTNGVVAGGHDDRDGTGRLTCSERRWSAPCHDYIDRKAD